MRPKTLCALLLLLPMSAAADESTIYESIDDLSIGPVFLTPGERRWLDANRHLPRHDASAPSSDLAEGGQDDAAEDAADTEPAGFIINSSGEARRYRNGEFTPSTALPSSMRFPDDVEIRRHEPEREADTEGPDDETVDD